MPDHLEDLHRHIDDLTDPDGSFSVVCPLSGKRPVPVRGQSFPSADVAENAVDLVREYRNVLRDVDPHLERIPLVAVEATADPLRLDVKRDSSSRKSFDDGRFDDERFGDEQSANGPTERDRVYSRRDVRRSSRQPSHSIVLSSDGDGEWLRMDDAPVVTVREDGDLLGDVAVERQLNAKL